MTDFYGANNTLTRNVPREMIGVGDYAGRVRSSYDSYTFAAVLTTSDSLKMMLIPQGARVVDLHVRSDDLGTTGLLNIGWDASADGGEAADADGFFAALDVKAAAIHTSILHAATSPAGLFKKFTEPVRVAIVPTENTTATSGDIELLLMYVLE